MAIITQPVDPRQRIRLPRQGEDLKAWVTDTERELELWTQDVQQRSFNIWEDLTAIDATLAGIPAQIAALQAEVDALELRMDAVEAGIVALEAAVDALEAWRLIAEAEIDALELALTPRSCMARRTSTQSIADATVTTVSLTGADLFDTASMHDPGGANPSRVLAPTAGSYLITGSVTWDANATGERLAEIRINGGSVIASQRHQAGGNDANCVSVVMRSFSYAELRVGQTSGGSLDILSAELCVAAIPEFP